MKRTTIVLPDELAALLDLECRRRAVPAAELVRRALIAYLTPGEGQPRLLPFAALGRSGHTDTARCAEAILAREWDDAGGR